MMGSRHLPPFPPIYWERERTERGDRQRYDSLTDRYGRPTDYYVGFEDLTIDARGRPSDVRVVDVRTIDPSYLDTRTSPGRAYQGHFDSAMPRTDYRDRERLRSGMAGRKSSVSLGRGMKKLHKVLGKSEDYFNTFLSSFDQDMSSIDKYSTLEIQDELWRLKVAGKKDKRLTKDYQYQQQEDEGEKPKRKFEEKKKELNHALQLALSVRLDEEKDTSTAKARLESAGRLQEKIRVAKDQISELLEKATKDRDHCNALVNEIRLLKALVDPDGEGNKDLFKLVDGEPEGASDAEEEGGSRDGWEN